MNVIESNILERDASGKPLHTFPHPALADLLGGRDRYRLAETKENHA
jgi:hypothetical protein